MIRDSEHLRPYDKIFRDCSLMLISWHQCWSGNGLLSLSLRFQDFRGICRGMEMLGQGDRGMVKVIEKSVCRFVRFRD